MQSWTPRGSTRDAPLCLHPKKKGFGLTFVVLGQVVAHLPNLFLIHKEKRKSKGEEKQPRKSQFVFTSSGDLHLKKTKCTLHRSLRCVFGREN